MATSDSAGRRDQATSPALPCIDATWDSGGSRGEPTRSGCRRAAVRFVADQLTRLGGPARQRLADVLHQAGASTGPSTPRSPRSRPQRSTGDAPPVQLGQPLRLWLGVAAGLSLTGPAGRRAAARGLLAIGVTSAVVNLGVKPLSTRHRPDRARRGRARPAARLDAAIHLVPLRPLRLGLRLRHRGEQGQSVAGDRDPVPGRRRRLLAGAHRRALPGRHGRRRADRRRHRPGRQQHLRPRAARRPRRGRPPGG